MKASRPGNIGRLTEKHTRSLLRLHKNLQPFREFNNFQKRTGERKVLIDRQVFARYVKHLERTKDLTLIILKGQLLIEEMINEAIESFVPHAKYLEYAHLRFFQKVEIVRSLSWDQQENKIWELILSLNGIRNDLAHSLESSKLALKIGNAKRLYLRYFPRERSKPDPLLFRDLIIFCARVQQ